MRSISRIYGGAWRATAVLATTSLVLVFGCARGKPKKNAEPSCVARVKGTCIEKKMLRPTFRYVAIHRVPGLNDQPLLRYVLDAVIDRELLAQEAEREGLTVTDAEVAESAAQGEIYLTMPTEAPPPPHLGLDAGRVTVDELAQRLPPDAGIAGDREKVLKTFVNSTPAEFRSWQARELLAAKMREHIESRVQLSEEQAFDRFVSQRSTATATYVFVKREWLERYAIPVDEKKVDAWAAANPSKLVLPVRHLLVIPKNEGDSERARKRAEELLERVKKGEKIAELAKDHSDDPESKNQDGLYGTDVLIGSVDELQDAVKALKPGELSPTVIKSAYGYHVLRREPTTRDANVAAFLHDRSEPLAKAIGNEIQAAVKEGKTLEAAAAAATAKYGKYGPGGAAAAAKDPERPQAEVTPPFERDEEPLAQISPVVEKEIAEFAFKAEPGQLAPELFASSMGSIVVQLKGRSVPTKEEFEKERATFVAQLLRTMKDAAFRAHVQKLREAAKNEITIDEQKLFAKRDAGAVGGPE